jgi:hypothetical protein
MRDLLAHPMFIKLGKLNLPSHDFAVFGSAPMWAHGLKHLGADIDLISRGAAWQKALTLGKTEIAAFGDPVVRLFDGEIEIFDKWSPGEWNTDELIDGAEEINGIRFVGLEHVKRWKQMYGREKDQHHIKLIDEYLQKQAAT